MDIIYEDTLPGTTFGYDDMVAGKVYRATNLPPLVTPSLFIRTDLGRLVALASGIEFTEEDEGFATARFEEVNVALVVKK